MHEMSDVEGEPVVVGHDWLQVDPAGIRYARHDGYQAAITAELLRTPIGWIGTTWRLQPVRSTIPFQAQTLDWAVRAFELAEEEGRASAAWAPRMVGAYGSVGVGNPWYPDAPRREGHMHNGRSHMYLERFGVAGASCWTVHINGEIQLDAAGRPLFFSDLDDAIEFYEREY